MHMVILQRGVLDRINNKKILYRIRENRVETRRVIESYILMGEGG